MLISFVLTGCETLIFGLLTVHHQPQSEGVVGLGGRLGENGANEWMNGGRIRGSFFKAVKSLVVVGGSGCCWGDSIMFLLKNGCCCFFSGIKLQRAAAMVIEPWKRRIDDDRSLKSVFWKCTIDWFTSTTTTADSKVFAWDFANSFGTYGWIFLYRKRYNLLKNFVVYFPLIVVPNQSTVDPNWSLLKQK